MLGYQLDRVIAAAESILGQGGWCVFEVCVDIPGQRWEARAVIFDLQPDAVAATVEDEVRYEPERDARLTGCNRRTLGPEPDMGAYLCYVAELPASSALLPPARHDPEARRRHAMFVREGMNPVVVTVGPEHTLREAARRMTARCVGAAVVIDDQQPGPCIITERDLLHSNGMGQSIDTEHVRDHLTTDVIYAAADWPLERAAETMVRGGFRHIIVMDGPEVAGILSMRDIVRCWTSDGASCEIAS